jgi:hypothetical protein
VQRAELQTSLETFTRSIRGPLATLPFEIRQRLLRLVVQRVMVEEGHVDIHPAWLAMGDPGWLCCPDPGGSVSGDR